MKKINFTLLTFLLTLFISCSNLTEEFVFMNDLKESISDKYETEKVEIKINNKTELIVLIKDSKFESYSGKEKARISYDIGSMAMNLKTSKEKIKSGSVKFISEENYGVVKTSEIDSYKMYKN